MTELQTARTGKIMFVIAWVFGFALLILFFHNFGKKDAGGYVYSARHGTLTIDADDKGHYWVDGLINQKPVRFMVDTGATYMAIPLPLATQLGLKGSYPVRLNTAGGEVEGELTRVRQMRFSGFSFNNVKAVIMPDVRTNVVLLGMNILSEFSITQKNSQLIIKR